MSTSILSLTLFPPYTLNPLLPISLNQSYLALLSLSSALSRYLYPEILASSHILVSWRPVTLYSRSFLLLYFCAVLISPLRSDMLALLLYVSFPPIFLHSASISSSHYPLIFLLRSDCSMSYLIISDFSTNSPL